MNIKKTFWSLLATFWILSIIFWIFKMSIEGYFMSKTGVKISSNSVTGSFENSIYIFITFLLVPFYFRTAHWLVKFRSSSQAWMFAFGSIIFAFIGYLLRWISVITAYNNTVKIDGLESYIQYDQLKLGWYFLMGSIFGCLILGFWMWFANQKLTSKDKGKL